MSVNSSETLSEDEGNGRFTGSSDGDDVGEQEDENSSVTSSTNNNNIYGANLTDKRSAVDRIAKSPRHWSRDEDERLKDAVELFGEKRWKEIAHHVRNRNHTQCFQRWYKVLCPGLKKGRWSDSEDEKLMGLALEQIEQKIGNGIATNFPNLTPESQKISSESKVNWGSIAKKIVGRTAKQCRERWVNNLNPEIVRGNWSQTEDNIILELSARYPKKWALMAKQLKGRTENAVKIRYYSLMRRRKRENSQNNDFESVNTDESNALRGDEGDEDGVNLDENEASESNPDDENANQGVQSNSKASNLSSSPIVGNLNNVNSSAQSRSMPESKKLTKKRPSRDSQHMNERQKNKDDQRIPGGDGKKKAIASKKRRKAQNKKPLHSEDNRDANKFRQNLMQQQTYSASSNENIQQAYNHSLSIPQTYLFQQPNLQQPSFSNLQGASPDQVDQQVQQALQLIKQNEAQIELLQQQTEVLRKIVEASQKVKQNSMLYGASSDAAAELEDETKRKKFYHMLKRYFEKHDKKTVSDEAITKVVEWTKKNGFDALNSSLQKKHNESFNDFILSVVKEQHVSSQNVIGLDLLNQSGMQQAYNGIQQTQQNVMNSHEGQRQELVSSHHASNQDMDIEASSVQHETIAMQTQGANMPSMQGQTPIPMQGTMHPLGIPSNQLLSSVGQQSLVHILQSNNIQDGGKQQQLYAFPLPVFGQQNSSQQAYYPTLNFPSNTIALYQPMQSYELNQDQN